MLDLHSTTMSTCDVLFTSVTGAEEEFVGVGVGFGLVAEVEFVFGADFEDFEAFGDEVGGKLPEFLELSVRVHDCRDVVHRVIKRNPEIVGHIRFSFAVKPRVFSTFCWHREARCRVHNAERFRRALSHGRRSIAEQP